MRKITTSSDLFKFLDSLRENQEFERQKEMAKQIKASSSSSKEENLDEDEEESEEEPEEESEDEPEEESAEDEKEKDDNLPGAKTLQELPNTPPANVQGKDVISRLKFIRAGSSLSDKNIEKAISGYVASLSPDEAQNLWIYVDAISRILLIGADPAEVESPGTAKKPSDAEKESKRDAKKIATPSSSDLPIVSPVVVGESVKRLPKEVDVPLQNGKLVPYGSKKHIEDLEARIHDLTRIRSYQVRGSDSRHTLTQAINSLKTQLRSAMRTYEKSHPKVEDNEQKPGDQ